MILWEYEMKYNLKGGSCVGSWALVSLWFECPSGLALKVEIL